MNKRIKMALYGAPGTGKSTFASKAPNPLFICSDGNFAWLDLPDDNGIEVSSWSECKKILNNKELLKHYETIVLDLTEDFFKFCEYEFCQRNKIEHVSDLGYGKAYDATRNEFFVEISKLFSLDKHVVLIMHGLTTTEKDRRGVEHTKYVPSSRIPDKLIDMIEGRCRAFLRCYTKDEELEDGKIIKRRYLSLVPKPGEFGIIRGVDENVIPQDIELDWNKFAEVIGLDNKPSTKPKKKIMIEETNVDEAKEEIKEESKEEAETESITLDNSVKVEVKKEVKKETKEEVKKEVSNEDKIAAIKAKLAKLKEEK